MSCANIVGNQFLSKQLTFTHFFRGADPFQGERKSVAEFFFSLRELNLNTPNPG